MEANCADCQLSVIQCTLRRRGIAPSLTVPLYPFAEPLIKATAARAIVSVNVKQRGIFLPWVWSGSVRYTDVVVSILHEMTGRFEWSRAVVVGSAGSASDRIDRQAFPAMSW